MDEMDISVGSSQSQATPKRYTLPTGLKPYQHLKGPSNYFVWARAMLHLFRANGVLHIMRDAIDPEIRQYHEAEGAYIAARAAGQPISGATALTSADLDVWDSSDDMTLLLRADALIDASIGKEAADRVLGVENVHMKWATLRAWGRVGKLGRLNKADADSSRQCRAHLFKTAEEFLTAFMEARAEIFRIDPEAAKDINFLERLMLCAGANWQDRFNHHMRESVPETWDPALRLQLAAALLKTSGQWNGTGRESRVLL